MTDGSTLGISMGGVMRIYPGYIPFHSQRDWPRSEKLILDAMDPPTLAQCLPLTDGPEPPLG